MSEFLTPAELEDVHHRAAQRILNAAPPPPGYALVPCVIPFSDLARDEYGPERLLRDLIVYGWAPVRRVSLEEYQRLYPNDKSLANIRGIVRTRRA